MVTNSASGKSKTGNFEIQLAYIIRIKEIYSVAKVYTSAYNRISNAGRIHRSYFMQIDFFPPPLFNHSCTFMCINNATDDK